MKIERIFAIVLRNLYTFRRNYDRIFDAFYWPTIDLIVWGLTSTYFSKLAPDISEFILIFTFGITFWLLVIRSQYESNISLLEEVWARNIVNIFISPLKFSEWIIGVTIVGVGKALMSFVTAVVVAFILYKVQIFSHGLTLIPFILLLLMTGWWTSYLIGGFIFRFGNKVQSFAWTLIFLLSPFSGIYYPISVLPDWAQFVAKFIPTSYVFEGIRDVVIHQTFDPNKLLMSFLLNCLYLILSIIFLKKSYDKLLTRGLLKVF